MHTHEETERIIQKREDTSRQSGTGACCNIPDVTETQQRNQYDWKRLKDSKMISDKKRKEKIAVSGKVLYTYIMFPWCLSTCQCEERGFELWVRKTPWRRK